MLISIRIVRSSLLLIGALLVFSLLAQPVMLSVAADGTPTIRQVLLTNTKMPTATRTLPPTPVIMGTYSTPVGTPTTPIPPVAPTPVPSGDDIVSILLLGSDTITPVEQTASRTDVMIVLVVDRTAQSVSMMHIPRDMYVYVPNYSMMKLNTVVNFGNVHIGPDSGIKLLRETLLYNYGIKFDHYARVNFVGFEQIVTQLGGLDISVDCALQGNRLKDPKSDYTKEENYELYTMPIGRQHLNGYMALWFVRSRGSSSDLDRGRRQIDVLRAMWRQAKDAGLFAQITKLWPEVQKWIDTDMSLSDVIGLAPAALNINPASIQRIDLVQGVHFKVWFTSDDGEFTYLPNPDAWKTAVQNLFLPPPKNRLSGENPTVDVGAAIQFKGLDQVAADRLNWEGFDARVIKPDGIVRRDVTVVYDYTGGAKPSSLQTLVKALRIDKSNIIDQPDPNSGVDFRVEMGASYARSCLLKLPDLPRSP